MQDEYQGSGTVEELPAVCSACGSMVDPAEWHPTRTARDEAGDPRLHVFCDEQCLDDWL